MNAGPIAEYRADWCRWIATWHGVPALHPDGRVRQFRTEAEARAFIAAGRFDRGRR